MYVEGNAHTLILGAGLEGHRKTMKNLRIDLCLNQSLKVILWIIKNSIFYKIEYLLLLFLELSTYLLHKDFPMEFIGLLKCFLCISI